MVFTKISRWYNMILPFANETEFSVRISTELGNDPEELQEMIESAIDFYMQGWYRGKVKFTVSVEPTGQ